MVDQMTVQAEHDSEKQEWDAYFRQRKAINERFNAELANDSAVKDYVKAAVSFVVTLLIVVLLGQLL